MMGLIRPWLPFQWGTQYSVYIACYAKVKVAHTRLPSVGFRSWSRFLAVSLQKTWVINPAVGCHYFQPGLQLPISIEGCYQFRCLVNKGTMGVSSLPKTVTRQRGNYDLNPGPSAPESSTLTTRLCTTTKIYALVLVQCLWIAIEVLAKPTHFLQPAS